LAYTGVARHQLRDERLLPDAGQVIGGRVFHREEVPAEPFQNGLRPASSSLPRISAITLVAKRSANSAMKRRAAFREQRPVLAVPVRVVEKQRAELGMSRMVVGEEERRRDGIDVERPRRVDDRADPVVVPGLLQPDGRFDRRDADHAAAHRFDEDEHVALVRSRRAAVE
jgi:hypothetical protein